MGNCRFYETCEHRLEREKYKERRVKESTWNSEGSMDIYWAESRRHMCEHNGIPEFGDECAIKRSLEKKELAVSH